MNREMRRLQEREDRRQKKQDAASGGKAQRKAAAIQSRPASVERKSFANRIKEYLHDVRQEMRKVTWPTREQMIAFSTVTVLTSIILTGVIFGLDVVTKEAVFWLLGRF